MSMEGNYYRDALGRCKANLDRYGKAYLRFYTSVQNLCASLQPGCDFLIDDYVNPARHDDFCDVVIVYECEQPYGDGEGLLYLSADRQRARRSVICGRGNKKSYVWNPDKHDTQERK